MQCCLSKDDRLHAGDFEDGCQSHPGKGQLFIFGLRTPGVKLGTELGDIFVV